MEEFFKSIKIKKMVLVYFCVTIIIVAISQIPCFRKNTALDFDFWFMIINFMLIFYFVFKLMKNHIDFKGVLHDFKVKVKWNEIIKLVILNIILSLGCVFCILFLVYKISPNMVKDLLMEESSSDSGSIMNLIFQCIAAVLLAPFVEESIFRGVILNRLSLKFKTSTSIIISSVLFGIIHGQLAAFGAILFGITMSILYLKNKNILVNISAHILNNLIVGIGNVAIFFFSKSSSNTLKESEIYIMGALGLFMLLISGFFVGRYIIKNYRFS